VDARPKNSLCFAQIQADLGIKGTYYFRMVPQSYDEAIIREIANLGHEIGYHYETMDTCKGDVDKAYDEFCRNLEHFRKITEIKTISMHGSPMSKFDNRDIWLKYDYKRLGIIAEPYFDINFNELYYITDTGRRWDGDMFNVRDKPMGKREGETERRGDGAIGRRGDGAIGRRGDGAIGRERDMAKGRNGDGVYQQALSNPDFLQRRYRHTRDIIKAVKEGTFPKQAMLNFHPQRWNDAIVPWVKELVWQNVKNQGKRVLVKVMNGA
jgi:hypothetical protein